MLAQEKENLNKFSLRKVPFIQKKYKESTINSDNIDETKILELSNIIDKWEQEVLFSDKGFYSLQGKEVENKLNDFILELDNFITSKINEINFSNAKSKLIVKQIKQNKINSIKLKMELYEQEQLRNWQLQVYETSISSSITRAILYKSDKNIIQSSFKNGINILRLMSEKEKWSRKIYKFRLKKYKSEFFFALINSFIQEKDSRAYLYFQQYKDDLFIDDKENIETAVKELKLNVIAYNFAKELYSYNISDKEKEFEIKQLKDLELKKYVEKNLANLKKIEEKQKEEQVKKRNKENWEKIIKSSLNDIEKVYLEIDYSLEQKNIKNKKEYINKIIKNGYINTEIEVYLNLLKELFENLEEFKKKDIFDFISSLSQEDFEFFTDFYNIEFLDYQVFKFDYVFLLKKLEELQLKQDEDKYNFFKLYFSSKNEYKKINKKEPDLEARNKIIEAILERYTQKHKH